MKRPNAYPHQHIGIGPPFQGLNHVKTFPGPLAQAGMESPLWGLGTRIRASILVESAHSWVITASIRGSGQARDNLV